MHMAHFIIFAIICVWAGHHFAAGDVNHESLAVECRGLSCQDSLSSVTLYDLLVLLCHIRKQGASNAGLAIELGQNGMQDGALQLHRSSKDAGMCGRDHSADLAGTLYETVLLAILEGLRLACDVTSDLCGFP